MNFTTSNSRSLNRDDLATFIESGCEVAFTDLVERHHAFVYRCCLRRLNGDTHLAEDATQSVFVTLFQKAAMIRTYEALPGWLYRAALSVTADLVRREQRRKRREQEAAEMKAVVSDDGRCAEWRDIEPLLDEGLATLSQKLQDAIILHFFEHKSRKEVASELGCSVKSIDKRILRGTERLQHFFKRRGVVLTVPALGMLLASPDASAAAVPSASAIVNNILSGGYQASAHVSSLSKIIATATKTTLPVKVGSVAVVVASALLVFRHLSLIPHSDVDRLKLLDIDESRLLSYFEPIESFDDIDTNFYIPVMGVTPETVADNAGLKTHDRIVGWNGSRVHNRQEYNYLRFQDWSVRDYTLHVIRNRELHVISIENRDPISNIGFIWGSTPPPKTDSTSLKELTSLLRREDVSARMLLAIDRMGASAHPDDVKWLIDFLHVYQDIRSQRFEQARQRIFDKRLLAHPAEPFLHDLLRFYERVATTPVPPSDQPITTLYNATADFIALCYPYPTLPERPSSAVVGEPAFQKAYEHATSGGRWSNEMTALRDRLFAQRTGSFQAGYLEQVRCAILDPHWTGGNPSTSGWVFWTPSRLPLLNWLETHWQASPSDRFITAYALLSPALMEDRVDLFRDAYTMLADAGAREWATANYLVSAASHQISPSAAITSVIAETESRVDVPPFYRWLEERCPPFRERMSRGFFYRNAMASDFPHYAAVEQPADWLQAQAHWVGRALCGTGESTDIRGALVGHALLLMEYHDAHTQDLFFATIGDNDVGLAFDLLNSIVAYRWHHRQVRSVFDLDRASANFFAEIEAREYESVCRVLASLGDDAAALEQAASAIFARAGVPSICLRIAQALHDAGRSELAAAYYNKVVRYHGNVVDARIAQRGKKDGATAAMRDAQWEAYRDFASVPMASPEAQRFRHYDTEVGVSRDASTHLLAATNACYGRDVDLAIGHIEKALAVADTQDRRPLLYNGQVFDDTASFYHHLIQYIGDDTDLTAEQRQRIDALRGRTPAIGTTTPVAIEAVDQWSHYAWFSEVGTDLNVRNTKTGVVQSIPNFGERYNMPNATVLTILPTPAAVFFGTTRGLFIFIRESDVAIRHFGPLGRGTQGGATILQQIKRGVWDVRVHTIRDDWPKVTVIYGPDNQTKVIDYSWFEGDNPNMAEP